LFLLVIFIGSKYISWLSFFGWLCLLVVWSTTSSNFHNRSRDHLAQLIILIHNWFQVFPLVLWWIIIIFHDWHIKVYFRYKQSISYYFILKQWNIFFSSYLCWNQSCHVKHFSQLGLKHNQYKLEGILWLWSSYWSSNFSSSAIF
jgi:hypothetical protein